MWTYCCWFVVDFDGEAEADNCGGVLSTDTYVINTQQESSSEYGANTELAADRTIASTDYVSQLSRLVGGSTGCPTIIPADQNTRHHVARKNSNRMAITLVCIYICKLNENYKTIATGIDKQCGNPSSSRRH